MTLGGSFKAKARVSFLFLGSGEGGVLGPKQGVLRDILMVAPCNDWLASSVGRALCGDIRGERTA